MTSRLYGSQASGLTLTPGQAPPLYQTTIGQYYWATIAISLYTAFEPHSTHVAFQFEDDGISVAGVLQPPLPKTERVGSHEPLSALERQLDTM